jgi:hypothetical protein
VVQQESEVQQEDGDSIQETHLANLHPQSLLENRPEHNILQHRNAKASDVLEMQFPQLENPLLDLDHLQQGVEVAVDLILCVSKSAAGSEYIDKESRDSVNDYQLLDWGMVLYAQANFLPQAAC